MNQSWSELNKVTRYPCSSYNNGHQGDMPINDDNNKIMHLAKVF